MNSRSQLNLLLVEDDEIDREALRRLLGSNYAVHEASTAAEAHAIIENHRPDCVILDYRLPDASGLALVPAFAEQFIPVILSTGEESPRVIVESMQQGAQDYLVKGRITRDALERAIHNAIEKVDLRRHLAEQREQLIIQARRLEESNRQVRALASALALAEQRERRRVAQILHDHVQQMLYGVQMRTFLMGMELSADISDDMQEHLAEMEELLNEAIQTTRTLTVELSPPVLKSEGLGAAFSWLANQMHRVHNLSVDLEIGGDYRLDSEDLRVLIFQLVRELLFNVVKHSQVDQARLCMYYAGGRLCVEVIDEGIGFDLARLHAAETQTHRADHSAMSDFDLRTNGDSEAESLYSRRATDDESAGSDSNRNNLINDSHHNGSQRIGQGISSSGFGLMSIRERLSLFDGNMRIESTQGKGTRVIIELPVPTCTENTGSEENSSANSSAKRFGQESSPVDVPVEERQR